VIHAIDPAPPEGAIPGDTVGRVDRAAGLRIALRAISSSAEHIASSAALLPTPPSGSPRNRNRIKITQPKRRSESIQGRTFSLTAYAVTFAGR
jgi:hypothetical protein